MGQTQGTEVTLHLDGCCIQTAALREYQRIYSLLMGADEDKDLVEAPRLELLRRFLAGADFASLRARRPDLDGRARISVTLFEAGDVIMVWTESTGG